MPGQRYGLWMQRMQSGLARLSIKSSGGNPILAWLFAHTAMKKTPQTFTPVGTAPKNSELFPVRRNVLGMVAHTIFFGLPVMLRAATQATAATTGTEPVCISAGEALARYGFADGHPLGSDRQAAFLNNAEKNLLLANVQLCALRQATIEELGRFHTGDHIDRVQHA